MNNINSNNFNNLCRTCMNNCDIKFSQDNIISNIFYKLTEIHFETNDELPRYICSKCFKKINEIHEFSLQCKRSHSKLLECLHKFQNPGINIKQELLEETNEQIKTKEITIDEHNLEIYKDEILNSRRENLKLEKVETNIPEEIISGTKDQNVNCSEDLLETITPDITEQNEEETNVSRDLNDLNTNPLNNEDSDIESAEKNNEIKKKHKCDLNSLKKPKSCDHSYKCEQCFKSFESPDHLERHMISHSSERPFKCEVCAKQYTQHSHLKFHMRSHTGERPYKCEQCSKTFADTSRLKRHSRTHTGERPYKCDHCSKMFTQTSSLKSHMRTHTGEHLLKCKLCFKQFVSLSKLKVHMRAHTGERPYQCELCSKTFAESSHLTTHMRTHTGERPYKCDHCSKTFTQSSNLRFHLRTHTGERPFACDQCNQSFIQLQHLKRHKRVHH